MGAQLKFMPICRLFKLIYVFLYPTQANPIKDERLHQSKPDSYDQVVLSLITSI